MVSGCGGCSDDKPYVPYTVSGSTPASSSAAEVDAGVPEPVGTFAVVRGVDPPGDGRTFPLGASEARPRSGRVFKKGLVFGADGDDADDLFAWTESSDGSKGELVYFRGGPEVGAESVLAKLPKDLDIGECSHAAEVSRIGQGVVVAVLSADCGASRGKEQWIAVARLDPARAAASVPELRLEARAKEPVALDAVAEDRDADKVEDLVFIAHAPGDIAKDRISANLVLWDRPTGYAWDPSEPEASLGKLGQALLSRAVAKKPDAVARAESAVRFARALCSDLGAPSVTTSAGAPKCRESRVVGDAVHAIALASNASGDIPRAVSGAELVSALKFDFGRVPQIDNLYAKKVKKVDAVIARKALARASKGQGMFSPLFFDTTGGLLVASDSEVTRVDVVTGEETVSEVTPWSRTLSWTSGDATVEIASATKQCGPASFHVTAGARGSSSDIELPVLFSLVPTQVMKDKCEKGAAELTPLLLDNDGAIVAVGGEVFRAGYGDKGVSFERAAMPPSTAAASPPGSARSADGKAAVLSFPKSLLVYRETGIERWKGADISNLRRCVINAAGDRVACLSGDTVVLIAPKTPTKK